MNIPVGTLTQREKDLALLGYCPYCKRPIRNWKVSTSYIYRTKLSKEGIDDITGHSISCDYKEITL